MRITRIKLVTGGAVGLFGLGMLASGCAPVAATGSPAMAGVVPSAAVTDATVPRHSGQTSVASPSPAAGQTSITPAPAGQTPSGQTPAGQTPSGRTPNGRKPSSQAPTVALPKPAHLVIVIDENHSTAALASDAPYLMSLEAGGATFTDANAIMHPSEPNYLALFSGSTHDVTSDSCPHTYAGDNLGAQLVHAGKTFTGYAESMPSDGYTGCASGGLYARKHNPWVNFSTVPATASVPFSRFPQQDFDKLPTVSWVVPNLCDDMHDCDVATGDAWLKAHLGAYATWARTHNSLLIVTFDEAETGVANRVPLVFYGAHVAPGVVTMKVDHFNVLRTIEGLYRLPCLGSACAATTITGIWR